MANTNSWDSSPGSASDNTNQHSDLPGVRSPSTGSVPNVRVRSRRAGHNRPKAASDWIAQTLTGVTGLVIIVVFGGAGHGGFGLFIFVLFTGYIFLVGWLGRMEDRAKAHRIWAVIWAITALLEVRAHNRRVQERAQMAADNAARPPRQPGTWNGIDFGNRR